MPERSRRRVQFVFDERSLMPREELEARGFRFVEIPTLSGSISLPAEIPARKTAAPARYADSPSRASAVSSCGSLVRFALALFSARIRHKSGPMLPGLGGDSGPDWSRSVTLSCPSDSGPAALALTTDGNECSCSPNYPTPTASLFGCKDVGRMLARRERLREKHGNGNGFGLTLGQHCAVHKIDLTPELVEDLMGFPPGWTSED